MTHVILICIEMSYIAQSACANNYGIAEMFEILSYLSTKLEFVYDLISLMQTYSQSWCRSYNRR